MNFFIPHNLEENFDKFLQTSVCHNIKYCHFFIPDDEKNEWISERAEITRINYKSKQYGSDGSLNIRLSKKSKLKKGDVISFNGKYYMASWYVHDVVPDSQVTIIDYLNVKGCFFRENHDDSGVNPDTGEMLSLGEPYKKITNEVYGFYLLNGSYEKRHKNSQAGMFNDNRISLMCQANPDTMKIKRGDIFKWHNEIHQVDDISLTEVDENKQGILTLHFGLTLNDAIKDYFADKEQDDDNSPFKRD